MHRGATAARLRAYGVFARMKRMLIDAAHPEETRVAVLDGNQLEEFDVESGSRKQLKGNIYLAKVTRVEPSLQAAFVDYGGNRHGFLAFNEIHPDYYQIPVADRERLIAEQEEEEAEEPEEIEETKQSDEKLLILTQLERIEKILGYPLWIIVGVLFGRYIYSDAVEWISKAGKFLSSFF